MELRGKHRLGAPSDVVVYGGTAAGVAAAVAAAESGASVALISPTCRLGGMTTGGLGATDTGEVTAIGGLARELYRSIGSRYGVEASYRFEPHVAHDVLQAWIHDAGIEPIAPSALEHVEREGPVIRGLRVSGSRYVPGRIFLDASYEGDLMCGAGVRYRVGRESQAEYGESLNGVRGAGERHQFEVPVDPYVAPGRPESGLLPSVELPSESTGSEDRRIEAYNFRLCLTLEESNRRPIPPPSRYDPRRYELLARLIQARLAAGTRVRFSDLFMIVTLPHGKTDVNAWGPFSTDQLGANHEYPGAGGRQRQWIWEDHAEFMMGLFHFLSTDARVPINVRREARSWGLCRDEFSETRGWPHQLYVREARRMIGTTVITQRHCEGRDAAIDPIAVAAFIVDTHHCRRIVQAGEVRNEGDVEVVTDPFAVSYGALTPRAEECENLLVPVCLSATHIAYGSLRTEPVFIQLGEAAGLAASQAAKLRRPVQEVDLPRLRRELEQRNAVVSVEPKRKRGEAPWPHEGHRYESPD